MKNRIISVIVLLSVLIIPAGNVSAQFGSVFGTLTTAETAGMGNGMFSGYVALVDQTSFGGSFTYGLSRFTDFRLKLGIVDQGKDTEMAFGADFKYQIMVMDSISNSPFDMAVGGIFEHISTNGSSITVIGGQLIASYPTSLSSGKQLIPYGRATLRSEKVGSNSDLEFGLSFGAKWELNSNMSLYGELQIDGNDGLIFGIDFATF